MKSEYYYFGIYIKNMTGNSQEIMDLYNDATGRSHTLAQVSGWTGIVGTYSYGIIHASDFLHPLQEITTSNINEYTRETIMPDIKHGWLHEYYHGFQCRKSLMRCLRGCNPPPWILEGVAAFVPDMWSLNPKFYQRRLDEAKEVFDLFKGDTSLTIENKINFYDTWTEQISDSTTANWAKLKGILVDILINLTSVEYVVYDMWGREPLHLELAMTNTGLEDAECWNDYMNNFHRHFGMSMEDFLRHAEHLFRTLASPTELMNNYNLTEILV